jgi:hypothetical protein
MQPTKRLSIRAVAMRYGLPPAVVSRAISAGELPAVVVTTETGRERAYISPDDAEHWFRERLSVSAGSSVGGSA